MIRGVFRINPYEARYRQLLANGASAWAGNGFARAKVQQKKTFHRLNAHGYLPAPGAPILELGCDNGVMAAQHLAEGGYTVSGVGVSETVIRWAEDRFQQVGLGATFFVDNACHLSQCKGVQFALIVDDSRLHCLLEDERRRFFAETRRLLKPAGRLVIGSICGLPHYTEDLATYDSVKHHLLKEGQPWRMLKPLLALLSEVQQVQFNILVTGIRHNARWDHATIVCPANGPLVDPQKS